MFRCSDNWGSDRWGSTLNLTFYWMVFNLVELSAGRFYFCWALYLMIFKPIYWITFECSVRVTVLLEYLDLSLDTRSWVSQTHWLLLRFLSYLCIINIQGKEQYKTCARYCPEYKKTIQNTTIHIKYYIRPTIVNCLFPVPVRLNIPCWWAVILLINYIIL